MAMASRLRGEQQRNLVPGMMTCRDLSDLLLITRSFVNYLDAAPLFLSLLTDTRRYLLPNVFTKSAQSC